MLDQAQTNNENFVHAYVEEGKDFTLNRVILRKAVNSIQEPLKYHHSILFVTKRPLGCFSNLNVTKRVLKF